jgi:hypothetical protein
MQLASGMFISIVVDVPLLVIHTSHTHTKSRTLSRTWTQTYYHTHIHAVFPSALRERLRVNPHDPEAMAEATRLMQSNPDMMTQAAKMMANMDPGVGERGARAKLFPVRFRTKNEPHHNFAFNDSESVRKDKQLLHKKKGLGSKVCTPKNVHSGLKVCM